MDVKEVADFKWDEEQDDSIAYISKQKLFVLRGKEAEEGIPCDGALLTEVALLRLDISTAEYAYVKMRDYCGLRFCERIMEIQDPHLKKAEIFIHLGRASDAEKVYIEQDRRDLAIDMYKRADEWLRVLRLVSISSNATDDKQRIEALTNVANYNKDRQRWKEAADHYELAGKSKELMECYIHLDDFYGLENLAKQLPDRHPLLPQIAELFASSGLCENAVQCFLRCGQISDSLDTCIQLNNWDKAVALSRTHNLRDVNVLMGKYVEELSESSERFLAAVQLYRRAGRFLDGARVVYMMAEDERSKASSCLRLKKCTYWRRC
ncbi:WD repeat-containing protein 35 [Parelaphostrongylus tenuis]|uniref:WD repeat-containing protein 35 n=1 Tax=Parelaphostrongylus tenuis TaxID=148309 RepID=A0AAD5MU48_PARTN|nr:WD repeat-containing protein 35 [Parelaphostrongylus tenuis]